MVHENLCTFENIFSEEHSWEEKCLSLSDSCGEQ